MLQKVVPTAVPLRLVVIGAQEVGKSALTVRLLTQRFIGEYSSQKDLLYCSQIQLDGINVDLEILDSSRDQTDCLSLEKATWSDGFVVTYSICSKSSFLVAADCLRYLRRLLNSPSMPPVLLLANKLDLEHCREVKESEGRQIASELGCVAFTEVSAAEGRVDGAFAPLLKKVLEIRSVSSLPTSSAKRKMSVASVSKIISAVFGRTSVDSHHPEGKKKKKRPSLSL